MNLLPQAVDAGRAVNVRDNILPAQPGQQEFLPRMLNGSQAKTAFALRMNAEKMIREAGVECIGFLTLTVGETDPAGRFKQVRDAAEASRRINNLNRRVLSDLFERAIIVTERHKSGAIHFHVLGVLAGRPDIRTGLNFEALKARDYRSANDTLRALWEHLREVLPRYGFGRSELLPVRETGEKIASYVSKYIEKNVCNRTRDDYRKKLVRYLGWEKSQTKANDISWASKRARAWRHKTREACALVNVNTREEAYVAFGPRWAFHVSRLWVNADENLFPGLTCGFSERQIIARELAKLAGREYLRKFGGEIGWEIVGEQYERPEFRKYWEFLKN